MTKSCFPGPLIGETRNKNGGSYNCYNLSLIAWVGVNGGGWNCACRYGDICGPGSGKNRHSYIAMTQKQTKAQFIAASTFWGMLTNFRVLWLTGRYGAGKTSLAFLCGAKLYAEGYCETVVSNIPCSFGSGVETLARPSAIILDESWIYVEGRSDVYAYAGFVRKFNHYLLLPSVFPIHARLSYFSVQRVFNAYVVGVPAWWYRWNLRSKDVKEKGYFGILNPKSIFGHYPTDFVAGDDGGISDELAAISKRAGYKGTRREQSQRTVGVSLALDADNESVSGDMQSIADEIEDSANEFTSSVQDMEAIQKAFKRHAGNFR